MGVAISRKLIYEGIDFSLTYLEMSNILQLILLGLSVITWLYFSIFCHEHGHFFCARLVGLRPYLIRIGHGFKISRKWLFQSRIELGIIPSGGMTHALMPKLSWSEIKFLKLRMSIYVLGGSLVNFALLLILISAYAYSHLFILLIFAYIEFGLILVSIIPSNIRLYGEKTPNDGKRIFQILLQDYKHYYERIVTAYEKAVLRYSSDSKEKNSLFNGDLRSLQVLLEAWIAITTNNFSEAIVLLSQLLKLENILNSEAAYILDTMTSIVINYRQMQYLTQADSWSQKALEIASYSKTIQGTRGAILAELGQYSEAKQMLLPLTEPGNEVVDIAISSCYLAKADFYLGNSEQAQSWLKYAEEVGKGEAWFPQFFASIKPELQAK